MSEWRPRLGSAPDTQADPPDRLTPETFAARLYAMLAPLAAEDERTGWSLLTYVNALGVMFQLIEDWVRDSEDGPGWSLLLDINRCPPEALPWLAQFAGVRLVAGQTDAQDRQRILSTGGFQRGTRAAMIGAAQATLTGAKTVLFRERSGNPAQSPEYAYVLGVTTYASQTPDPTATRNALLGQKPAGIVLNYATTPGQTWQQLRDSGRTWAQVKAAYATWNDVRNDQPT